MIRIRAALPGDAGAIGAVHVAGFRNAYPGILSDHYLQSLSAQRLGAAYAMAIGAGAIVRVASQTSGTPGIVGFATAGPARKPGLADGEIETLYVLDDFRERGLGRQLLSACATALATGGCTSVFLWVLRDNPSRFFYDHIGGVARRHGSTFVGGVSVAQVAYVWDPIERLIVAD